MAQKPIIHLSPDQWRLLFKPYDRHPSPYELEHDTAHIWSEGDEGEITSGYIPNKKRYHWCSFEYPMDIHIQVFDTYTVDFCTLSGQIINDFPYTNMDMESIRDQAQEYADEYEKTISVVFVDGDHEDFEVEPDA